MRLSQMFPYKVWFPINGKIWGGRGLILLLTQAKPKCRPGFNFVKLLEEDEEAFDILYCIGFAMMDAQWLAMRASYMEFNDVLRITRTQLERELSLDDVNRVQDLLAYNLLYN